MHMFQYINGLNGLGRLYADYSQHTKGTENSSLLRSDFVIKNTSCGEGCQNVFNYESEVEHVHCELESSSPACYPVSLPNFGGPLPAVYVPGPTVFVLYLFLRMYLSYRVKCVLNKPEG